MKKNSKQYGDKYDQGKNMLGLISPYAIEELGKVLTFGAGKYSPNNWRKGFPYSKLIDAMKRHTLAFEKGEKYDSESGLHHMAHAMWYYMVILEFEHTRPELNDLYFHNNKKGKSKK